MIFSEAGISTTPPVLGPAEAALCGDTGGVGVLWCGRGATALYWAFRAAVAWHRTEPAPAVILPAVTCESVAQAALAAGLALHFADADPATGMPGRAEIERAYTPGVVAVVVAHLYGQTTSLTDLAGWCCARDVILIEDAAHALGGYLPDGSPVGSVGGMTIYSFNRTKIIEPGGGALLVRDAALWDLVRDDVTIHEPTGARDPRRTELLGRSANQIEHGLGALFRLGLGSGASEFVRRIAPAYRSLYLQPIRDPAVLASVWPSIPGVARRRADKAAIYADTLAEGPWRLTTAWAHSRTCWRFSLVAERSAYVPAFVDAIRARGALVSTLYWTLTDYFGPEGTCPAAREFGAGVINLCVDDTVSEGWVRDRAADVLQCGRELFAAPEPAEH